MRLRVILKTRQSDKSQSADAVHIPLQLHLTTSTKRRSVTVEHVNRPAPPVFCRNLCALTFQNKQYDILQLTLYEQWNSAVLKKERKILFERVRCILQRKYGETIFRFLEMVNFNFRFLENQRRIGHHILVLNYGLEIKTK